jgi:quercetin dioxygenase-like cupin family protein
VRVRSTAAVLLVLTGAVLAGCAQPGQLGHPVEATPAPAPAAAVAPVEAAPIMAPAPQGPVVIGAAHVDDRLTLRTLGEADLTTLTDTLDAGASTGWKRNPGPELVIVKTGAVALQVEGACKDDTYAAGKGFAVPDGKPYQVRNTGDGPVELVVTRLFAPGFPEPEDVPAACP